LLWQTHVSNRERMRVVIQITLHLIEFRNWLSSIMNVAEKAQFKLDEILPEAAQIETDGTHNWILSFKKASAQHGSYR
jgi:hypothetical protein